MKRAYPAHHAVPISKAMRAGDFVFTSAYGPWVFDPLDLVFDDNGVPVGDGTGNENMPFEEQVHKTFGFIQEALATEKCTLEDVVKCECWLTDARNFVPFNAIYKTYFKKDPPVRSVFPMRFMFTCKIEMQVIAHKPISG
ncbi:MAG: RidA family protein [Rhizobiales bacterium]|nr:RidA family protein [Hyphomicrobiales bacterium]